MILGRPNQSRQPTPGEHQAVCGAPVARRGCALRSLSMKTLAIFMLCWLSALAAEASDVHVITMTTTNAASSTVTTVDVFMRNGATNLVRQTKIGDGGVDVRLHQFYHDGSLVAEFGGTGGNRAFTTSVGSPYRLSFGFGPTGEIFSALIATKDGVCVDAFGCTNGMFYPEDASGVNRLGAYMDASKGAVVGCFPGNSKAPERR